MIFFGGGLLLLPAFCALLPPVFLCREALIVSPFSFFFFCKGRHAACFFLNIRQAGKRDVGRDCSAKSAAAERERKLLMNECQSFSVARCF